MNHGHVDIVRQLLDCKANINVRANNGITALIDACNSGQLDIIELLLRYSAKTNIRTNNVRLSQSAQLGRVLVSVLGLHSGGLFDFVR